MDVFWKIKTRNGPTSESMYCQMGRDRTAEDTADLVSLSSPAQTCPNPRLPRLMDLNITRNRVSLTTTLGSI